MLVAILNYLFQSYSEVAVKKLLTRSVFLFIPIIAILFVQCSEQFVEPNYQETLNKVTNDNGGNMKNSGTKDYGDLIVCLRDVDGIPGYLYFPEEHDPYFPLPIKFYVSTGFPATEVIDGTTYYLTFKLDSVGIAIPEDGFFVKEADFGRLSLVRAPESVLDAALLEAIAGLDQTGVTAIKTDASGRLVAIVGLEDWDVNYDADSTNDEFDDKTIDSPVENMAIYKELMNHGFNDQLSFLQKYFSNPFILAVGALAAGADKTGNIMVDEIAYLNNWILDWSLLGQVEGAVLGPDPKGRSYYNYGETGANFAYNRADIYANKYIKITTLNSDGTWTEDIVSLLNAVPWTSPERLIDYSGGANTNISGFANAVDDAIQVLELIHSTDLIVYSPYFVP